jgi:hypothetical protein
MPPVSSPAHRLEPKASVPEGCEFVHQKAVVGVARLPGVANKLSSFSVFLANRKWFDAY